MPELIKLKSDDFIKLRSCVPSGESICKKALMCLPSDSTGFKEWMKDWINNGRRMINFGEVRPMIIAMFAVCAMDSGVLKQQAIKVSDKILTGNILIGRKTILDLVVEGRGKELETKLFSDSDFKNMVGAFFGTETEAERAKLVKDILYLIGKMTVPRRLTDFVAEAVDHLTGKKPVRTSSGSSSSPRASFWGLGGQQCSLRHLTIILSDNLRRMPVLFLLKLRRIFHACIIPSTAHLRMISNLAMI